MTDLDKQLYLLAGEAVRKCRSGDSISDEELAAGIRVLTKIIPPLLAMGDCYYLVFSDLNSKLSQLEGFQNSRRRK